MSGMNDDRRPQSGRSIREIISDATDRELKDFATGNLTPDELVAMAAAEERRRKRRMRRISGIAALFVIVLACGAFFVFSTLTTDVDADKNPKQEIVTEDGVIIEDGGWGSSSEDTWEITDWNEVNTAKATIPELMIPEYIPEGYEFERLTIEHSKAFSTMQYCYISGEHKELVIQEFVQGERLGATVIDSGGVPIETSKGTVYYLEGDEINKATIKINSDSIIEIWANLSDFEMIKIIENLDD